MQASRVSAIAGHGLQLEQLCCYVNAMRLKRWVAAAGLAVCKQTILVAISIAPAGVFLLLAFLGWNTLPLAAIMGAVGLLMAAARLFGEPDEGGDSGFD